MHTVSEAISLDEIGYHIKFDKRENQGHCSGKFHKMIFHVFKSSLYLY